MAYELKLFTGSANRPLAEEIAQYLHVPVSDAEVSRFSDGEVYVQINENVRGADVFVIQPTCPPVNDTLMELLIMVDAMKRASARRITAVLPYYGYARQDRKVQSRVPISARLVADLLEAALQAETVVSGRHADNVAPSLLGGAVVTETVFSWPGLGRTLVRAVAAKDYPVAQAAFLMIAAVMIFIMGALLTLGIGLYAPCLIMIRQGA